jgi:hypothetical protein
LHLRDELLKKKMDKLEKIDYEADYYKMAHEIRILQKEIEMQNEELIQANEAAETALRKYTMLYDFAPMGYFTLESDGIINELNFTGAEMLGDKRFSLVNSNFKLFITDDSRPVFDKFFSKVFSEKGKESCEIKLGYNGNPACTVYMEGVVTGEDKNCLLSVVDISGFRK